jgi:hypothetical protein
MQYDSTILNSDSQASNTTDKAVVSSDPPSPEIDKTISSNFNFLITLIAKTLVETDLHNLSMESKLKTK